MKAYYLLLIFVVSIGSFSTAAYAAPACPAPGRVVMSQGYPNDIGEDGQFIYGNSAALAELREMCSDGTLKQANCRDIEMTNADIQKSTMCSGYCVEKN